MKGPEFLIGDRYRVFLKGIISLIVSGGLLAALFLYFDAEISRQIFNIFSVSSWALVISVMFFWVMFSVSAARYRWVLKCMILSAPSFWLIAKIHVLITFLGHFLPIGLAAEAVRIGIGRLQLGLGYGTATASVIYDRIFGLFGIVGLGLLMLPVQIIRGISHPLVLLQLVAWVVLLLIMCLGVSIVVMFIPRNKSPWIRINEDFEAFVKNLKLKGVLSHICFALFMGLSYSAVVWVLILGFDYKIEFFDVFQFSALFLFAQNLPFLYQGWGGREAVIVGVFSTTGFLDTSQALSISIAVGVAMLISTLPGSFLWRIIKKSR